MNSVRKWNPTEQQSRFVHHLVNDAVNPTEAARRAGYNHPKENAYNLTRNPHVQGMIRLERQRVYQTDLASLSVQTLKNVMTDDDAPASARVSAARTALELAGDLGKNADGSGSGRSLAEMTPDELAQLIDQWEGQRADLARDITPEQPETSAEPTL
jgi:phage terminase small subunit